MILEAFGNLEIANREIIVPKKCKGCRKVRLKNVMNIQKSA